MKRKNASDANSSFDMLLDTMCNTFGGVCFIALLIAIISASLPDTTTSTDEDIQAKIEEQRLENLYQKETELKDAIKLQKSTNAQLLERFQQDEIVQLQDLSTAQEKLLEQKEILHSEIEKIKDAIVKKEIEKEHAEVALDQAKVEEKKIPETYTKKRQVRLPNERAMQGYAPHTIWLVNGRLYDFDNENDVYQSGKKSGRLGFSIRNTGGREVTKAFLQSADFRKMATQRKDTNSNKIYLRVITDDRSFRELCMILDRVNELGGFYNWHQTNKNELWFGKGVDTITQ